jgi:GWxTD domain-containing protein
MNRTFRWLIICALVSSPSVLAQLSPSYQGWGQTAVQYLMMLKEKTDWASVKTDADAKAFIELFWARRDPTPTTPANELRQQFENRIADADKRFSVGKMPGSQTDHGLVYVLLGEPTQIVTSVTRPQGSQFDSRRFQRPINFETWIYRGTAAEAVAGTNAFDIAFVFQDEKFGTEFELDGPSKRSFESSSLVIAKSVLKRPFLTAEDLAGSARTVPLRMIVVADRAVASDILRRAQEGEDFAGLARKFSSHNSAQQGGYIGRIEFADLDDDIRAAVSGKKAGATVLITRSPFFVIVRLLTDAEAAAADAEKPAPK